MGVDRKTLQSTAGLEGSPDPPKVRTGSLTLQYTEAIVGWRSMAETGQSGCKDRESLWIWAGGRGAGPASQQRHSGTQGFEGSVNATRFREGMQGLARAQLGRDGAWLVSSLDLAL